MKYKWCYNVAMTIIISKISAIFLIMAVGFFLNKLKVLPSEATKYFVDLLLMVTTPCMILASITSKEFNPETAASTLQIFICGISFFAVSFLLGWFLCKKILKVQPPEDLGVYIFAFSTINSGFMGFPITKAIFGGDILYLMILHNICLTLYMYSAGPFILNMNSGHGSFDAKRLLKTFCNPSTILSVVSIVMLFAGLHLPKLIFDSVELVGDITVPLSMLVVGMQLGESNIGRIIKNKSLVLMSILKMTVVPALVFLLVNWLPLTDEVKVTAVFAAAFPTAVVTSALALMEKKNSLLSAEAIALTTLISVGVIPVTALLLSAYYGL